MALAKRWERVSQAFTANGTTDGIVTVSDATGFFAKQKVSLISDTQQPIELEVKKVFPTTIQVGRLQKGIDDYIDISQFLTVDNARITANQQVKPSLQPDEIFNAAYQHDPAVALRNLLVNKFGVPVSVIDDGMGNQRIAVDATFGGTVAVNLDAFTKSPPDNAVAVGTEDGTKTGTKHAHRVDSALDLRVGISNGSNKAGVNASSELLVHDADVLAQVIALTTLINGVIASGALQALNVGTENGTTSGVKHVFVNNARQMILATHDRTASFTYADFGTKDERITRIDYTSPTFLGITARRDFNYTLVGTKYRRDNEVWSIV